MKSHQRGWHRDDLTTEVRRALLLDAVSLDTLALYVDHLPRGELESVMTGTRAVSPLAARILSDALRWMAGDVVSTVEELDQVLSSLPPSVRQQAERDYLAL